MKRPVEPLGENGSGSWSTAGIRDYWLDGSHHTKVDCEVAERILVGVPNLAQMVRAYRELLGRVVRYLVGAEYGSSWIWDRACLPPETCTRWRRISILIAVWCT